MPKIFEESTMRLVWDMVTNEQKKLREIATEFSTNVETINRIYQAAYRRFGCNQHRNRKRSEDTPKKLFSTNLSDDERPPAVYSNRSAWGIASEQFNTDYEHQ